MHKKVLVFGLLLAALFPVSSFAATAPKLVYSAWMPYWAKASGTPVALQHLATFNSLSPFAYEVEDDGTIVDSMKLATDPWTTLIASSSQKKVKIIPSILWIHGDAIHTVLAATSSRTLHVDDIVSMVTRNNFDGIDIDYENKKSITKDAFSAFIKDLAVKLYKKHKLLVCTIEARTPPSSLYRTIPKNIEYVNDYKVLNRNCDQIRIMTYDQTTADISLSDDKGTRSLYAPVADTDWVNKVVTLATKTIDKKKIMIGVATYGYVYKIDTSGATTTYEKMRAISDPDARALALVNGIQIGNYHNEAGELSFNYSKNGDRYYVSWSDANAVKDKIALAKKLGVKGVVLFKIDGKEDPLVWNILK